MLQNTQPTMNTLQATRRDAAGTLDAVRQACVCPITLEIMRDPVIAADHHTYERAAISKVFREAPRGQALSPITREVMAHGILSVNHAVRGIIDQLPEGDLIPLAGRGCDQDIWEGAPLPGGISPQAHERAQRQQEQMLELENPTWFLRRTASLSMREKLAPSDADAAKNAVLAARRGIDALVRVGLVAPLPWHTAARLSACVTLLPSYREAGYFAQRLILRAGSEAICNYYGLPNPVALLPSYRAVETDPHIACMRLIARNGVITPDILQREQSPDLPPLLSLQIGIKLNPTDGDKTRIGVHIGFFAESGAFTHHVPLALEDGDKSNRLASLPNNFVQRGQQRFSEFEYNHKFMGYRGGPRPGGSMARDVFYT